MFLDELCSIGKTFVEDEKYILSRYEPKDQELYLLLWNETFVNSLVFKDENFKKKSWEDVLSNTTKLQLKVIDKTTQAYIGEVLLTKLNDKEPELGIQLLQKYHGFGIGTRVMNLFVSKLK